MAEGRPVCSRSPDEVNWVHAWVSDAALSLGDRSTYQTSSIYTGQVDLALELDQRWCVGISRIRQQSQRVDPVLMRSLITKDEIIRSVRHGWCSCRIYTDMRGSQDGSVPLLHIEVVRVLALSRNEFTSAQDHLEDCES
jgi:hypothetical protein